MLGKIHFSQVNIAFLKMKFVWPSLCLNFIIKYMESIIPVFPLASCLLASLPLISDFLGSASGKIKEIKFK